MNPQSLYVSGFKLDNLNHVSCSLGSRPHARPSVRRRLEPKARSTARALAKARMTRMTPSLSAIDISSFFNIEASDCHSVVYYIFTGFTRPVYGL